jgi:hypothetical protein
VSDGELQSRQHGDRFGAIALCNLHPTLNFHNAHDFPLRRTALWDMRARPQVADTLCGARFSQTSNEGHPFTPRLIKTQARLFETGGQHGKNGEGSACMPMGTLAAVINCDLETGTERGEQEPW